MDDGREGTANGDGSGARPEGAAPPLAKGAGAAGGIEFEPLGAPGGGTTSPRMLVPLFLVPLLIVAVIVAIFYVVGRVVAHEKSVADLIEEVQSGGRNERWQAAAHLTLIANQDPAQLEDPAVRARLRGVFQSAGPEDTELRIYLARIWGRIGDVDAVPLIVDGVARMKELLAKPGGLGSELYEKVSKELIYYLLSLGELGVTDSEASITGFAADTDPGIRWAVAFALGEIGRKQLGAGGKPSEKVVAALLRLHDDADPFVRINAALSLARVDRPEGLPTLRAMLDRAWLKSKSLRFPDDGQFTVVANDPPADVIIQALSAIGHLVDVGQVVHGAAADAGVRDAIEAATRDQNPTVQGCAKTLLQKLAA